MKYLKNILLFALMLIVSNIFGQQITNNNNSRSIEVLGYAEEEVVPDEIYVRLVLKEYFEGRIRITMKEQEETLIKAIQSMGYELENIRMTNSKSSYTKILWQSKEAISINTYVLKLSTAEEVKILVEKVKDMSVFSFEILSRTSSQLEKIKENVRAKAIQNAIDKADNMLKVLGETRGKVIIITESPYPVATAIPTSVYYSKQDLGRQPGRSISSVYDSNSSYNMDKVVEFDPITVTASIYVKFEIK